MASLPFDKHRSAVRLGVPSGGSGPEERIGIEVVCPQGHKGEQAEQRRGGAQDGTIGPLALGFQTEMGTGFLALRQAQE